MVNTNQFKNSMFGYNSQNGVFTNSISATVDTTNGLAFSPGDTQSITGITGTLQKAVGVRLWFKGGFSGNSDFLVLHTSATGDFATMKTQGNNIEATQMFSSSKVTFTSAKSSLTSSSWIMIGLSAGYVARGNQFIM